MKSNKNKTKISKINRGFPSGASGKEPTCQCRRCWLHPWVGKIPWRRAWQSIPENTCLENPMDKEAWWATVHSVA